MSYGQINYPQNLGTGPSVDTIADVGCFLTAFCNLLERYGEPVDPPTLNNYFIAHGSYLADGPNRDNLGWGSVSAYDGNVVATQIGGAGWPPHNEAIVKFIYKSQRTGAQITHFCLVVDHTNGTILDSWDGKVKHTPYGNPVAWATYEKHSPQVVAPPPPVEAPAFRVENIPAKSQQLTKNTHLWDLNQRSWPGLVNNPVGDGNDGSVFTTSRIAHHVLGGNYYIPDGTDTHGYNVVDCRDYVAPPAPSPSGPPAAPIRPGGNPDNKYTVIKTIPGYSNATNAGNHVKQVTEVAAGDYFVYNTYPNRDDLVNVTSKLGTPGSWINKADNVPDAPTPPPTPPPAPEPVAAPAAPVEPTPPETHVETAPVDSTTPISWEQTFRPFPKPIHYIATRDITVQDLSNQQGDMPLKRYNAGVSDTQGVVSAFGTVSKDGVEYYRLKTNNDPNFTYWYCVPKLDENTRTPNLLVMPTTTQPIGKVTVARDTLHLAKSRLETDLPKFLDDMVPKFLRNKKQK
jgi:hypothetical protein